MCIYSSVGSRELKVVRSFVDRAETIYKQVLDTIDIKLVKKYFVILFITNSFLLEEFKFILGEMVFKKKNTKKYV